MTSKATRFLIGMLSGLLLVGGSALGPAAEAQQLTVARSTAQAMDDQTLIVNTDLVSLTVTVTDRDDRFIAGLDKSAFTVYDGKLKQEITFFSEEDAPVSVGIVFDMSGSMSGEKIARAREAVARFIETSHPSDEYFLIAFDSRARLLLDRTHDGAAILNKVAFVQPGGRTALYDAAYLGVEKLLRGMHERRALIVISDGEDNSSRYSLKELVRQVKESGVLVYTVGILDAPVSTETSHARERWMPRSTQSFLPMESASHQFDRMTLEELSLPSGGRAFLAHNGAEMADVFERIALELRHQYSIGYRPTNFAGDGKWHRIKIKVNSPAGFPHAIVRAREGYYAVSKPGNVRETQ